MREAFAHEAVLWMEPDADVQAPGAAITVALCGHWEHEPPCPLAPHFTSAERSGRAVRVRTLFVVEAASEPEVQQRIRTALAAGQLAGPNGKLSSWELCESGDSAVLPSEVSHAARLAES